MLNLLWRHHSEGLWTLRRHAKHLHGIGFNSLYLALYLIKLLLVEFLDIVVLIHQFVDLLPLLLHCLLLLVHLLLLQVQLVVQGGDLKILHLLIWVIRRGLFFRLKGGCSKLNPRSLCLQILRHDLHLLSEVFLVLLVNLELHV